MKLLLVRHGQSRWQVEGDVAGDDAPLTRLGELQAHRLGDYLAAHAPLTAIYASDLRRAARTAEIIATHLCMPPIADPALREFDAWEAGWAPEPRSMWDTAPNTPELAPGYAHFRARIAAALRRILEPQPPAARVLFVVHGGVIGAICRILLGSDTPRFATLNTALHELEWERLNWGANWVVNYLNQAEHLPPFMRTG